MDRLIALEADVRYQEPPLPGEPEHAYRRGSIPVLISAPHGAVHTRSGGPKEEEEYTAAFAQLVAEETDAHALYLRRRSASDPSWHVDVPYKRCLARIVQQADIRFVIDLHGAAGRHDFGVALGTLAGRSCPAFREPIIAALGRCGFSPAGQGLGRLDVDKTFTARGRDGQETVTRYTWERLGTQVAQLELNEKLRVAWRRDDASSERPFRACPEHLEQALRALVGVVQAVEQVVDG